MRINRVKDESNFSEKILKITRVSKTITGGRTMSFSILTAVGDKKGNVGLGLGKAKNVADGIRKGLFQAKRAIKSYSLKRSTIPHEVIGKFGATKVLLKPAPAGRGLIAGSVVRDICELVGIHDVFTKIIGSKNKGNVAKATINALSQLMTYKEVATLRGIKI